MESNSDHLWIGTKDTDTVFNIYISIQICFDITNHLQKRKIHFLFSLTPNIIPLFISNGLQLVQIHIYILRVICNHSSLKHGTMYSKQMSKLYSPLATKPTTCRQSHSDLTLLLVAHDPVALFIEMYHKSFYTIFKATHDTSQHKSSDCNGIT